MSACSNGLLIRRDIIERHIVTLLREKLYTPVAIGRLVEKVNARLRAHAPAAETERRGVLAQLESVRQQLVGLRQFIVNGDTSPKVRVWLAEAEENEVRLEGSLAGLEAQLQQRPLQVHPSRVMQYLEDLRTTLQDGGRRAHQLLQGDIKRINIHAVTDAQKPFARAEIVSTGKGLLDRIVLMVAGARNHRYQKRLDSRST